MDGAPNAGPMVRYLRAHPGITATIRPVRPRWLTRISHDDDERSRAAHYRALGS
ncbi:MAG: hypothetical protein ACRDHZ_00120 [Ktedonobacteraceae bacterium]